MKATRVLIGAALLLSSGAATAQSVTDAQCLLLSNAFANGAKDPKAQKVAEASIYFYLGRIRDGATAADLKTILDEQAKAIPEATSGNLMNGCVKTVQDKLKLVESLAPPAAAAPAKEPPKKPQGR